jgi:hypothetical protein
MQHVLHEILGLGNVSVSDSCQKMVSKLLCVPPSLPRKVTELCWMLPMRIDPFDPAISVRLHSKKETPAIP